MSNGSRFDFPDVLSFLKLTQPSSAIATFSTRHRAYLIISTAIYLLSNNLVHPDSLSVSSTHTSFFETLDSVFAEMPIRHRLASVRAAFEALLSMAGVLKQRFAFKSLVEIGAGKGWLANSTKGHEYLCHAVCMDLDEVVKMLLESGCRPDRLARLANKKTTAIVEALERKKIESVKLLLENCDLNRQFQHNSGIFVTNFTVSIQRMHGLDEIVFDQGISLFLNAGADINSLLHEDLSDPDQTPD